MRITQGAARRKMAKAATKAREAASKAEASKLEAEQAAQLASEAVEAADAAVQSTTQQLEEAKAACAEGGCERRSFWWLDREFEESDGARAPNKKPRPSRRGRRRVGKSGRTRRSGPESPAARHTAGAPFPLS